MEYNREKILKYLESLRWPDDAIVCPYDSFSKFYRTDDPCTYVCAINHRNFTAITGTPLEKHARRIVQIYNVVLCLLQGYGESDIIATLDISQYSLRRLYKDIFIMLKYPLPKRQEAFHNELLERFKRRKATRNYVFSSMLGL